MQDRSQVRGDDSDEAEHQATCREERPVGRWTTDEVLRGVRSLIQLLLQSSGFGVRDRVQHFGF